MTRLYRFTHKEVALVKGDQDRDTQSEDRDAVPTAISLSNLTMFSAVLFMTEFRQMGIDSVDVSKTCNMSEWHRRLYSGTADKKGTRQEEEEEEYVDVLTLPPKAISQSGQVYATTRLTEDGKETFSSFLFAHHKQSIATTLPADKSHQDSGHLSPEAHALVSTLGATHIWLCGSDPAQRRHGNMSACLKQLERDVLEWKESGQGSGVMTVHTIPAAFPGMVQFAIRNGFKGGAPVVGGESGKVLYFKEL